MARHSSITRRVLYMWPSKVQLVRSSMRTRSSRPSALQVEQRLLDRGERHRAVHRVLRQRERLDVERLAAAEHQAVVVRLVAVAVDDDDVARLHQRLHHHLVAGGRAVGDEEHLVRAEGARRACPAPS